MSNQAMKSLTTDTFLISLLVQLGQDCGLHWRDIQTLVKRTKTEGNSFVTKTMPLLAKALLSGLGGSRFTCPTNFKRKSRSALPAFLGSLFAKVFDLNGQLLPEADASAIACIRQVCEFAYKADFPYKESEEQAVIDKFVSVEEELSWSDQSGDPILTLSNLIAREMFSDYDSKNLNHKHGPGVTANVNITKKWVSRLTPAMPVYDRFANSFFFNENDGLKSIHRYPVYSQEDYFVSRNIAKVILVPKDSRGPRLISCEPFENQWVQQGIAGYMVDKLESHPWSRGHVNFRDQSINRLLALENSKTREFSTLDLKDASDRVSMSLVERIFEGTDLLDDLRVARSEKTLLPDGRLVFLRKHAPMGSALCFPVMASTIYLLIVAGLIGLGLSLGEATDSVYVYGDDIIVRTEYAQFTIDLLERYRLRVNKEKSYINSPFLESCGMDAFKGIDVTPVRLRKSQLCPRILKLKPQVLVGILATANLLAQRGFSRASQYCYKFVESWLGPLPHGNPETPYLCRWITPLTPVASASLLNGKPGNGLKIRKGADGLELCGWRVQPVTNQEPVLTADIYRHMHRAWGSLWTGNGPIQGEYTLPRRYNLARKWYTFS